MRGIDVRIWKAEGVQMPSYGTEASVGLDLAAKETVIIAGGCTAMISTGVIIAPPLGYFTLIALRSSMAKQGFMLANGVGIIDPDYCGEKDEIKLLVYNSREYDKCIEAGQRIAQAIFIPVFRPMVVPLAFPSASSRGGFGSTGA